MNWRLPLLLVAILLGPGMSQAAEEALAASEVEKVLSFAEHLYEESDYYRAITEYKRALYLMGSDSRRDWIQVRIGHAYLQGEQWQAAWLLFDELAREATGPDLRRMAGIAAARALYRQDRQLQARIQIEDLQLEVTDPLQPVAQVLWSCASIRLGRLDEAGQALANLQLPESDPLAQQAAWLQENLSGADQIPRKSPTLAGLLSLVPGLGHVYIEDYGVAFAALVWNGLFGYALYDAFAKDHIGVGTLLSALELFWYTGTIYGAVSGAHRYNRDAERNFLLRLGENGALDVDFPDAGMVRVKLWGGRF